MSARGDDPVLMLTAPIAATEYALARAGMTLAEIDLVEINEAFAPVVLAWQRETGADLARVNVYGGAIALGHPLGATGARLMTTLLHALERTGGRYGLVDHVRGRRPGQRHDHRAPVSGAGNGEPGRQALPGLGHDRGRSARRRTAGPRSARRPALTDIRPRSGRPSTIAARSSIGVFAAISTWAQVSSRAAAHRPALRGSARRQLSPDRPRNAAALRADRARPLHRPACSRRSTSGVRSTRCGTPSTRVVTTVPVNVAGQVDLLDRVGHRAVAGQQEPGAHRDPGRAVGERGGQPAAVEEPARRDDRDVHRVHDLRDQQAGRHRAGVAAALAAGRDDRVDAPGRPPSPRAAGRRPRRS